MKITIKDREYKVKYTIRALFIFEQIMDKPFGISNLMDNYMFYYCMILANNEECLSWEEFMDALDEDIELPQKLANVIEQNQKAQELFNHSGGEEDKESKKD
jgi:hypothetical protein